MGLGSAQGHGSLKGQGSLACTGKFQECAPFQSSGYPQHPGGFGPSPILAEQAWVLYKAGIPKGSGAWKSGQHGVTKTGANTGSLESRGKHGSLKTVIQKIIPKDRILGLLG